MRGRQPHHVVEARQHHVGEPRLRPVDLGDDLVRGARHLGVPHLEPVRGQLLSHRHVIAGQELAQNLDAQHTYRHVAELHRAVGDVGDLGDAGHQVVAVPHAVASARRAAQLAPGAPHDARDQGLRAHHLEGVEDVREEEGEVDQRQRLGDEDARHRYVVDLDLGADKERVEDRRQSKAEDEGVERVAREDADDAWRVARRARLDAEHHAQKDDAQGHALGASYQAEGAGRGRRVGGEEVGDRGVVLGVEEAEQDDEHERDGDQRQAREDGSHPPDGRRLRRLRVTLRLRFRHAPRS